jgi:acyl-CoA reductase-like NAD-dependent aldehyde dehydrogenase
MSSETVRSVSPQAPTDIVGEFVCAGAKGVVAAVEVARLASREWQALGAAGRAAAMMAAAQSLAERREEAAELVVREVGKPVAEARGELTRAVSILEYYAESCFSSVGDLLPPSLTGLLYTERRPWGVAGLITPWNFPLAIPLWKAAPALAAGNGVVLKPSPFAAACAQLLDEILSAHLPEGLMAVAQGGVDEGTALLGTADVISFTGSAAVGRAVVVAGAERAIPVQCEMGGQNAAIVLPDADPGRTAAMIATAAMGYAGQKCTATRRVIVIGPGEAFVEALESAVEALSLGAPAETSTVVGPVISAAALASVEGAIEEARAQGGRVLAGGGAIDGEGWYASPTVITDLEASHRLAQTETFGPLSLVLPASDLVEALSIANAVPFGLVTSIHGRDMDQLLAGIAGCDTGLVKVNAPTTGVDFYAPFGGEKGSSYGPREQGMAALDFYSATRTITIAPHSG